MLILSVMESVHEAQAALAVSERASAAPYVDYPPTPKWYPFAVGAWCALMVLALHGLSTSTAVFVPIILVLVAAEGAFIAWYRRYRKTMPTMRNAPREINAAFKRYFAGCVVVLAVCVAVYVFRRPVRVRGGRLRPGRRRPRALRAQLRDGGRGDQAAPRRVSLTGLDPIIHAPKRLAAMAILANSTSTDFAFLRGYLEIAESDLSKQMATLERAGYIKTTKSGRGRGSVTTYEITKAGKTAYVQHVAALRAITASADDDEVE